eukprot:11193015-Lingulodinium_polyedra.AAC.1
MFSSLGDEKVIEGIRQHIRDLDRGARRSQSGPLTKFCQILTSNVLAGETCAEVRASDESVLRH